VGPRVGLDRCGKSRFPLRFDPRTVQPRSQLLYRLRYPAHMLLVRNCINTNIKCICSLRGAQRICKLRSVFLFFEKSIFVFLSHISLEFRILAPRASCFSQRSKIGYITFWHRSFTFKFQHILYVKCE